MAGPLDLISAVGAPQSEGSTFNTDMMKRFLGPLMEAVVQNAQRQNDPIQRLYDVGGAAYESAGHGTSFAKNLAALDTQRTSALHGGASMVLQVLGLEKQLEQLKSTTAYQTRHLDIMQQNADKPHINIIQDEWMRPQIAITDPTKGTTKIIKPTETPGTSEAPGTGPGGQLTGDEYRTALRERDPAMANLVENAIAGKVPPMNPRSSTAVAVMKHASAIEPAFDMSKWTERNKTRQYYGSVPIQNAVQSGNFVIAHLKSLTDAGDQLDNTDFPALNAAKNFWARNIKGGERAGPLAEFQTKAQAVGEEMMRLFRVTQGSVQEVQDWKAKFRAASTPAELKSAVSAAMDLIKGRLDSMSSRHMTVFGEPFQSIEPHTKAYIDRINKWSGSTVTLEEYLKPGAAQKGPQPAAPTAPQPRSAVNPGDEVAAELERADRGPFFTQEGPQANQGRGSNTFRAKEAEGAPKPPKGVTVKRTGTLPDGRRIFEGDDGNIYTFDGARVR